MSAEKFSPVMLVGHLRQVESFWELTLTTAEDIRPVTTQ